ncbi:MAG: hypothetical protein U1D31_01650 [Patescibacteria group bacterium]|nr:hypothetical protein [bacterium]MDZ4240812.1 hypothetical protein [Patescibacteria group bacterium]
MRILERLFEDVPKIRMMRLFLFNPDLAFGLEDITRRLNITTREAKKQLAVFSKAGVVRRKEFFKEDAAHSPKRRKGKVHGWTLNKSFPYVASLQTFLIDLTPFKRSDIVRKISRAGRIKLVVLSGVFLNEWESRVDLLVVGDHLKKRIIESLIKNIESEIGRELKYAIFETQDFNYRLGMYDRLVRDITDYPHETLLDKVGFEKN